MTRFLHLLLDPAVGPALWAHERFTTAEGTPRARLLNELMPLAELDAFAPTLPWLVRPLRQRARVDGRAKNAPLLPLPGVRLATVLTAFRRLILDAALRSGRITEESDAAQVDALITELAEGGRGAAVLDGLALAADALTVLDLDSHARRLVAQRRVVPQLRVDADVTAVWVPAERTSTGTSAGGAWLDALVDTHARTAFDEQTALSGLDPDQLSALDPVGAMLVAALGGDGSALTVDAPGRRRLQGLLTRFADSSREGALLRDRAPELVVRVQESTASGDAAENTWLVQACLRETGGAVHPLSQVLAAGDISSTAALGHAAQIRSQSPMLRTASASRDGLSWALSTGELSRFISEDSERLADAQIVVLLPREWTKAQVAIVATVHGEEADSQPQRRAAGQALTTAIGRFDVRAAIGGVELSDEEMAALLQEQSEIVKLRGEWVRLDGATLRAAEKFLAAFQHLSAVSDPQQRALMLRASIGGVKKAQGAITAQEWQSLLLSDADGDLSLDVRGAGRSPGIESLFTGDTPDLPVMAPPATLRAALRPYQQRGLDWLTMLDRYGLGGILADDMGLGKTMQILALLCREREAEGWERAGGPTLLVVPMSVIGSWQREAQRFAPHLAVHVHHGPQRLRAGGFTSAAERADLVITTYALLARDLSDLQSVPWFRVILDEAQHIKNAGTQVARAARQLPPGRRIALTGTPVENDLSDLHSIMEFTNPGMLGSSTWFTENLQQPIEDDGDEQALARLRRATQMVILRRLKTDQSIIQDLPTKTELDERITLTAEQAGLIHAIGEEMSQQLPGAADHQRKALISSAVMRIKQVCNHPAHYLGDGSALLIDGEHRSGKLERIDDLLEMVVANREKALIFTQFTQFAPRLVEYWEEKFGIEVPFLHGGLPKRERDEMVARFQAERGVPGAMVLSLRAGGTGITLTAANHVIHMDRWWNPAVENQATDRAFRIGQTRTVSVRRLIAAGTIEEAIADRLAQKQDLADLTVASGEGWLLDLEDGQLLQLLRGPGLDTSGAVQGGAAPASPARTEAEHGN